MNYNSRFCFTEKTADGYAVAVYERDGRDTATLLVEYKAKTKEDAHRCVKEFLSSQDKTTKPET